MNWRWVSAQTDIECRHPSKIRIHQVPGWNDNAYLVKLFYQLKARLRAYGIQE